ncbi:TetR family transcriptional regulator [Novosphingobium lindaniclasticum]|nr:TetR family transcriptional regulator [Novosphingobium lindaniclasticum]
MRTAENPEHSSQDRLIRAALEVWSNEGHAAMSARNLSRATGLPTSSIYHHFGSMEQLLQSAQAAARDAAQAWCSMKLDEMSGGPEGGGGEAIARALAVLIDDWTAERRELAFAWSQCYLLAQRDEGYAAAINSWRSLWADFWRDICGRAGLAEYGAVTSHLFEGTCQHHLIRWNRMIDRAALDEFCMGWGHWLSGSLVEEGPWRRHARGIALKSEPEVPAKNGVAEKISNAAADVVENLGVAGLTHRAVAARADVTLGVVSYNFRTSADLVQAAFEVLYRRLTDQLHDRPGEPHLPDEPIGAWKNFLSQPRRLVAIEELTLAVARDPGLRDFAPQLRYLRGRSSRLQLVGQLKRRLGGEVRVSPLDAALYSSMISGQRRALTGRPQAEVEASLDEAARLVGNLRRAG